MLVTASRFESGERHHFKENHEMINTTLTETVRPVVSVRLPEKWGNPTEKERWRRMRLAVAAFAYEFENDSIMSDVEFDRMSQEVDLSITTGNRKLDSFFRKYFHPDTGQWVHKHPEKHKLSLIYERYWKNKR